MSYRQGLGELGATVIADVLYNRLPLSMRSGYISQSQAAAQSAQLLNAGVQVINTVTKTALTQPAPPPAPLPAPLPVEQIPTSVYVAPPPATSPAPAQPTYVPAPVSSAGPSTSTAQPGSSSGGPGGPPPDDPYGAFSPYQSYAPAPSALPSASTAGVDPGYFDPADPYGDLSMPAAAPAPTPPKPASKSSPLVWLLAGGAALLMFSGRRR